jgi:hypothetical protein
MRKKIFIKIITAISFLAIFSSEPVLAQTVDTLPQNLQVGRNSNFSLTLNVGSVTNLFSLAFDLNFNPSLIDFVSATEGSFLNQGCQTSLMATENPVGKLIFGLTRLGAGCGGVSGSGTVASLNFKSLAADGTNNLSFSNNYFCILSGANCNYTVGTWNANAVVVRSSADTTPPAPPSGVIVW